jgi:hypothetical protein
MTQAGKERDLIRLANYFITQAYQAYFNPDLPSSEAVNDLQAAVVIIQQLLVVDGRWSA